MAIYHTFPQPEDAKPGQIHYVYYAKPQVYYAKPETRQVKSLWSIFRAKPAPIKSVAEKLAEVCEAVGGVGKNGKNTEDGYRYQRWRDIAAAVRGEMAKRRIVLIPGEVEILSEQRFPTQTVKHGQIDAPLVELKIKRGYRVTDGITSEFGWGLGVGQDYRDKALYKAETGCLKYFLRGLFLIPDVEDDPEEVADRAQSELAAERVLSPEQKIDKVRQENAARHEEIAERALRAWNTLCHRHGKTIKQRREYLSATFGVKSIVEVKSKLDFDKAIVWASSREEMAETLAASVVAVSEGKAQPIVEELERTGTDPF